GIDLRALGHNSPAYLHRIIETVKLAFSDRHTYYGDPHFIKVPAEQLLSKAYAEIRRRLISDRAFPDMPAPGDLAGVSRRPAAAIAGGSSDDLDTSYVAVIDAQ